MTTALLLAVPLYALAAPLYTFNASWRPAFPSGGHTFSGVALAGPFVYVTQRGNTTLDPVVVLSLADGSFVRSWGKPYVAIDSKTVPTAPTWGAHGIAIERCDWPCQPSLPQPLSSHRVYIQDFTGSTVRAFSPMGSLLLSLGTPGTPGNGTHPIQFDHVADAVLVPGAVAPARSSVPVVAPTTLYATDGDGGAANRVVRLELDARSLAPTVRWATGHRYHNPHSITRHARSDLLVVADREDLELRLVRASDGADRGVLDCGLGFGPESGRPFGVRTFARGGLDLLLVASMDNPQDHLNQRISVLDVSGLSDTEAGAASRSCVLLQTITIPPAQYSGPHLLGVDEESGDLYAALVADQPMSTVLKFTCSGC